jgi:hypothetical protein
VRKIKSKITLELRNVCQAAQARTQLSVIRRSLDSELLTADTAKKSAHNVSKHRKDLNAKPAKMEHNLSQASVLRIKVKIICNHIC